MKRNQVVYWTVMTATRLLINVRRAWAWRNVESKCRISIPSLSRKMLQTAAEVRSWCWLQGSRQPGISSAFRSLVKLHSIELKSEGLMGFWTAGLACLAYQQELVVTGVYGSNNKALTNWQFLTNALDAVGNIGCKLEHLITILRKWEKGASGILGIKR